MTVPFVGDTNLDTSYVSGEHPQFIIKRHRMILTINNFLFITVIFFSITVNSFKSLFRPEGTRILAYKAG